ncbi:MAG: DUF1080 domain-containing protein [Bacteroidia bacterium]|nr:DUF1080 domain-containing protein [Bacteroidia bacterium]
MPKHFRLIQFSILVILLFSCQNKERKTVKQYSESDEEWIQLFNGTNLDDWIVKINGEPLNSNIHNTFRVEDGVLKVSYDGYEVFGESYGHIFYKQPFSNYKLKLQYRFVGEQVKDGQNWAKKNSGVMIHSQSPESMGLNQGFPVSLEVQLLGGIEKGIKRPTGNLCTPGTHVTMNDKLITEHCTDSSSETFYGVEWVNLEVKVLNDSLISHNINGKEVINYSKPIIGGEYSVDDSKVGKPLKEGYISLQSESHPIEFKSIELLMLKE